VSLGPVLSPEACAPRYPHKPGGKERERDRDRDTLSRTRSLSLTTLSLSPALCLSPARSHHTTNMTQPRHVSYRQPTCPGGTNSRRRGSSGSQGLRANHSAPHVTNATRPTPQANARARGGTGGRARCGRGTHSPCSCTSLGQHRASGPPARWTDRRGESRAATTAGRPRERWRTTAYQQASHTHRPDEQRLRA
jgi:hypothetical protein